MPLNAAIAVIFKRPTKDMCLEFRPTKAKPIKQQPILALNIFNFIQYRKPVVDYRNLCIVVIKILIKISYPK